MFFYVGGGGGGGGVVVMTEYSLWRGVCLQEQMYSGSSHKWTPSGHKKGVSNCRSWPLMRMVLGVRDSWRLKGACPAKKINIGN